MSRSFGSVLLASLLSICEGLPSEHPDLRLRHFTMQPETGQVDHTPFLWTAVVNNPDQAPELFIIFYSEASDLHWREEMQLHSEDTPFLYSLELEFGEPGYYEYQLVIDIDGHRELGEVQVFWVEEAYSEPVIVEPRQNWGGLWSLRLPMEEFSDLPEVDLLWLDPIGAELHRQSYRAGSTGDDFLFFSNLRLPDPTQYLVWTELQADGETWLSSVEVVEGH